MSTAGKKAVVIGSSIGGLAQTRILQRYGYDVSVIDHAWGRFGAPSTMNGATLVYRKAQDVLRNIGVLDPVYERSIHLGHPMVTNTKLQPISCARASADIPRALALDANTLREILLSQTYNSDLPSIEIKTTGVITKVDDAFSGLTPSDPPVTLEFQASPEDAHSTSLETNLVVAADGTYSPFRLLSNGSSRVGKQNHTQKRMLDTTLTDLDVNDLKSIFPKLKDGSEALLDEEGKPRMFQACAAGARIGAVPVLAPGSTDLSNPKFNLHVWIIWSDGEIMTEWATPHKHVRGKFDEDLLGYATEGINLSFNGNKQGTSAQQHPFMTGIMQTLQDKKPAMWERFPAWDTFPLAAFKRQAFIGSTCQTMPHSLMQEDSVALEHAWEVGAIAGGWPEHSLPVYVPHKRKVLNLKQPLAVRLEQLQKEIRGRHKVSETIAWQFQTFQKDGFSGAQRALMGLLPTPLKEKTLAAQMAIITGHWDLPQPAANFKWPENYKDQIKP